MWVEHRWTKNVGEVIETLGTGRFRVRFAGVEQVWGGVREVRKVWTVSAAGDDARDGEVWDVNAYFTTSTDLPEPHAWSDEVDGWGATTYGWTEEQARQAMAERYGVRA